MKVSNCVPFAFDGLATVPPSRAGATTRSPPLPTPVVHVVLVRPQEEVFRVRADRIVAVVTDTHPFRDGTTMQQPRQPVGQHWLSANVRRAEGVLRLAIAASIGHAPPSPAAISSDYILLVQFGRRQAVSFPRQR